MNIRSGISFLYGKLAENWKILNTQNLSNPIRVDSVYYTLACGNRKNMNENGYLSVGIRLLGIYYAMEILSSVFLIVSAFSADTSEIIKHPSVYYSGIVPSMVVHFVICIAFLFRAHEISKFLINNGKAVINKEPNEKINLNVLAPFIVLMGIFFFLHYLSKIVEELTGKISIAKHFSAMTAS